MMDGTVAVKVTVRGKVQGVGYRHWTQRRAVGHDLSGYVRNRLDGSVEAVFAGPQSEVEDMIARCKVGPRAAEVTDVSVEPWPAEVAPGFMVLATA